MIAATVATMIAATVATMIAATVAAIQLSLPVKATRGAFHPATLVSLLKDLHTDQCSTAHAELDAVHIDKGFKQGYVAAVEPVCVPT